MYYPDRLERRIAQREPQVAVHRVSRVARVVPPPPARLRLFERAHRHDERRERRRGDYPDEADDQKYLYERESARASIFHRGTLRRLRASLMAAQREAEELYVSGEAPGPRSREG